MRLHTLESLTVVRAIAGDVIHMPRSAVHMVITLSRAAFPLGGPEKLGP